MAGLVYGMGIYGVTKHAVVAPSESMWNALRAAGHAVGVSVPCPGSVRTRIFESERYRPVLGSPHLLWLNVVDNRIQRILDQKDPIGVRSEGGMGIEFPVFSD